MHRIKISWSSDLEFSLLIDKTEVPHMTQTEKVPIVVNEVENKHKRFEHFLLQK